MGYSWHLFTFNRVPVRVSIWFGALLLYLGLMSRSVVGTLMLALCVALSVLVHEFGHAFAAKRYKLRPRIMLHGWGGYCEHDPPEQARHDGLILIAGPAAGFALGALMWAVTALWWSATSEAALGARASGGPLQVVSVRMPWGYSFASLLMDVSFLWSFINLLPVYPLDGGRLFQLWARRQQGREQGDALTHKVGVGGALLAGSFLSWWLGSGFFVFAGLYYAYVNFMALKHNMGLSGGGFVAVERATDDFGSEGQEADELIEPWLERAYDALEAGHFREAAQRAHQLRTHAAASQEITQAAWSIIVVASAWAGDVREARKAMRWAPNVPLTRLGVAKVCLLEGQGHKAWAESMGIGPLDPRWGRLRAHLELELMSRG